MISNSKLYSICYIFITPILMVLLLVLMYETGHAVAAKFGREYSRGVNFGISLYVSTIVFYIFSLMQSVCFLRRMNVLFITTVLYIGFYISSLYLFGGYYGGFSHPLRTMYFHLCSIVVFYMQIIARKISTPC